MYLFVLFKMLVEVWGLMNTLHLYTHYVGYSPLISELVLTYG